MSDANTLSVARWLYRRRWALTFLVLSVGAYTTIAGGLNLQRFSAKVQSLKGSAVHPDDVSLEAFDARFDIWFDEDHPGLKTYKLIEDKFVGEDFILLAFEETEDPLGVFSTKSLETVARLTRKLSRIPYVRHVRSLTSNPWIRWGDAGLDSESGEREEGLLVSDLFERAPSSYSPEEVHERMIAVLGAKATAARIGEHKVRAVLGPDARFEDHIGEPRLHNNIVSADGTTTALQLLILRPRVGGELLKATFGDDHAARRVGPEMFKNKAQWSALTAVEHTLAAERGLFVRATGYAALEERITALPEGPEKESARLALADPATLFCRDPDGNKQRKFHFYRDQSPTAFTAGQRTDVEPTPQGYEAKTLGDERFYMAGMSAMARHMRNVGLADMKYVALMFAVILTVLFGVFRKLLAGPLLVFSVMILSIVGMTGFILIIGDSLNNLTAVSPTMLCAISLADAMHLVAAYYLLRGTFETREQLICEVLARNFKPILLTTVTTALGFFSLGVSQILPIKMLGYTAGAGVIIAFCISMTLVPAMLSLLPLPSPDPSAKPKPSDGAQAKLTLRFDALHWGVKLTAWVVRNRLPIVLSSLAVLVASLVGFSKLNLDGDFRAMFLGGDPVIQNLDWIDKRLGGTGDLEMVFSVPRLSEEEERAAASDAERVEHLAGRKLGAAQGIEGVEPLSTEEDAERASLEASQARYERGRIGVSFEFLERIEQFERRLQQEIKDQGSPLFGVVTRIDSPLAVLRKIHQVQNQNKRSFYRLPNEGDVNPEARAASVEYDDILEELSYTPAQNASTLIGQYYLQYENGAKPTENLSSLISADRRDFRVQGRVLAASSKTQLAAYGRIESIAAKEFPDIASTEAQVKAGEGLSTFTISGRTPLLADMMKMFEASLIESLGLGALLITIVIGIIYRSLALALLSLIPNLLPIFIPLAFLGYLGEPISGPTVLVATVALGVCVDDTLHFFTKFVHGRERGWSTERSIEYAFQHVGAALGFTTLVLCVGFATLALSSFVPNKSIGYLSIWMFLLAIVADFIVTPAFLSFIYRRADSKAS